MIQKLKLVTIPVRDQDRAVDFYVNTLGFTLATDQPMGKGQRWVEVRAPKAETNIALFTPPGLENRIGTFTGIGWECDNIEKTHRELVEKGVQFAKPPEKQPWGTMAILKDSEGNEMVLSEGR